MLEFNIKYTDNINYIKNIFSINYFKLKPKIIIIPCYYVKTLFDFGEKLLS